MLRTLCYGLGLLNHSVYSLIKHMSSNHPTNHRPFDCVVSAPFGYVGIAVDAVGESIALFTLAPPIKPQPQPRAKIIAQQIHAYLIDPMHPLAMPHIIQGTPFQRRVWQAIATIPAGQTLTYSQLAACVQSGPRAVANACGANPVPLLVPCHRVVARAGLGGFMQGHPQGLAIKRWLLAHEQSVSIIK